MRRAAGALLLLWPALASARPFSTSVVVDTEEDLYDLELAGELSDDEVDLLVALLARPIDVNRAGRQALYELPGVTYELAGAIVTFRAAHGPFASLAALLEVEGMDRELLLSVEPFVTLGLDEGLLAPDSPAVRARAKLGALWRDGVPINRDPRVVTDGSEIQYGPQGYLRAEATGYAHFGAGLLASYRRRQHAHWSVSRGVVLASPPRNEPVPDALYLYWVGGPWSLVLGSFQVGFGERLTFDTTNRRDPVGWYGYNTVREDNEAGRLSTENRLLGLAVSAEGLDLPVGRLDATLFGSYQPKDVYQYDFSYGTDAFGGAQHCRSSGDCLEGYTCQLPAGVCRSSRIYDERDPTLGYQYATVANAYREGVAGGNVTLHLDDRTRVGVTAYNAWTAFDMARAAEAAFAPSARWPREPSFGAAGAFARAGYALVDVSAEYAYTFSGGHGAYGRLIVNPVPWAELVWAFRYYGPGYENPFGRGEAQPDETLGLSQRNERGTRLLATFTPLVGLRFTTDLDLWQNRHVLTPAANGSFEYTPAPGSALSHTDLAVEQRASYTFTSHEAVNISYGYTNKDLQHNTRAETYLLGDLEGRGEKHQARVEVRTLRVPGLRLSASYTWTWQDVSTSAFDFERAERLRVRASYLAPWQGRFVAGVAWWRRQVPFVLATRASDRQEPTFTAYLECSQQFFEHYRISARYGLLHYLDGRPERYAWYQLAKLYVQITY